MSLVHVLPIFWPSKQPKIRLLLSLQALEVILLLLPLNAFLSCRRLFVLIFWILLLLIEEEGFLFIDHICIDDRTATVAET